jgi:hypothetical protein
LRLAEEVLADPAASARYRYDAWGNVARIRIHTGDLHGAELAALEGRALADRMGSHRSVHVACDVLWSLYRKQGRLRECAATSVEMWRANRRAPEDQDLAITLDRLARVRLLQATVACGAPPQSTVPTALGLGADPILARRRLRSARRFVRWALPVAQRVDAAQGGRHHRNAVEDCAQWADELGRLLEASDSTHGLSP